MSFFYRNFLINKIPLKRFKLDKYLPFIFQVEAFRQLLMSTKLDSHSRFPSSVTMLKINIRKSQVSLFCSYTALSYVALNSMYLSGEHHDLSNEVDVRISARFVFEVVATRKPD